MCVVKTNWLLINITHRYPYKQHPSSCQSPDRNHRHTLMQRDTFAIILQPPRSRRKVAAWTVLCSSVNRQSRQTTVYADLLWTQNQDTQPSLLVPEMLWEGGRSSRTQTPWSYSVPARVSFQW